LHSSCSDAIKEEKPCGARTRLEHGSQPGGAHGERATVHMIASHILLLIQDLSVQNKICFWVQEKLWGCFKRVSFFFISQLFAKRFVGATN
jgi:hypothetical protein